MGEIMSEVMGVKVYMEHGSCATLIAMFDTEETYMACVPALEALAFENNSTISESCDEFVLTPEDEDEVKS